MQQAHIRLNKALTPQGMGISGLYAMALGAWLSPPLSMAGQLLMLVGLMRLQPSWRRLASDRILQLAAAFTGYVMVRSLAAGNANPLYWADHFDQGLDLVRLGFGAVLLPAIWMARDPRRLPRVAFLAFCGFGVETLRHLDYQRWAELLHSRPGFGMPANAFGLYCAVALLGLIVFAPRILKSAQGPWPFAARSLLWTIGLAMLLAGLLVSQSRSAWLASGAALPTLAIMGWRLRRTDKTPGNFQWPQMLVWTLGLLVVSGVLFFNREPIHQRVTTELESIQTYLNGAESDRYDSVTARVHIWRLALSSLSAKPVFGWGPAGPQILLDQETSIQVRGGDLRDFHNTYLEILVQLGLVGGIFWALFLAVVLMAMQAARRSGWLPPDGYLFAAGGILIFMIGTAFNLRTGDHSGREFVALFGGMTYAYRLRWMHANPAKVAAGRSEPIRASGDQGLARRSA